jgi:hypothetical protein
MHRNINWEKNNPVGSGSFDGVNLRAPALTVTEYFDVFKDISPGSWRVA